MERARHIGIAATLGALLLLLSLLLYTPPGLTLVARMVPALTGGTVRVEGLGGFFPTRLHVARLEIADSGGTWLTIDRAALRWSPLALLNNHVAVQDMTAARITILRQPIPSASSGGQTPRIDVERLDIARIDIAAPVVGRAATLSAKGALHYVSRHDVHADLSVTRAGTDDSYRVDGGIAADVAQGTVVIREGHDGILGRLAGLPGLGPVNLSAHADGDARANRLRLALSAGPLHADGRGTVQLATQRADLDFTLAAPAMAPRPDIAWQRLSGDAHVHGPFQSPALQAHLLLAEGKFFGLAVRQLTLQAAGDRGSARLTGSADGVTLPGDHPDLIARDPVTFQAQADLKAATLPVRFAITHPLASLHGIAHLRGDAAVTADLAVPSLAPFAALQKIDMGGRAGLHIAVTQTGPRLAVALDGRMNTQGSAVPARLLGRDATLRLTAVLEGSDLTQSQVQLHGAAIDTDVEGTLRKGVLNYKLALDLSDLSRLAGTLQGTAALRGSAHGPMGQAGLSVGGSAVLATKGFPRQRVTIDLQADDLPALRAARLTLDGRLNGAAVMLHAAVKGEKKRQIDLAGHWKSLNAKAGLVIDENAAISGKASLALRQLSDIAAFTGNAMSGAADVALTFRARKAKTDAVVTAAVRDVTFDAMGAHLLTLHGTVADMMGKPALTLAAEMQGMAAQGFEGQAQARLDGPLDALAIVLDANLKDGKGAPLSAKMAASLKLARKQLAVTQLDARWRGVPLTLRSPVTVDFANGLGLDHLAMGLGSHGTVTAAGRILPQLALTASATDLTLRDFRPFLPQAGLPQAGIQGTVSASVALHGTPAAPQGTVSVQGRDLRADFASRTMPSGALDARAQLAGDHAAIAVTASAGSQVHLTLDGTAPLTAAGMVALRAGGTADLSLLDPFLAAAGRRARGTVTFHAAIGGTMTAPRITGSGRLAGGEIQDFARGARLHDIAAAVEADGARIRLTELTAHAGQGTITGTGSIDLDAADMPVEMTLKAANARPIASDLITATVSGDVRLSGHLRTLSTLSGQLQVTAGEINLPDSFPPDVAVLNVRRRGQAPLPPPPPSQSRMALDVAVRTTGPIFVRGHGMDADMGGSIRIGGTSTAPAISGGFTMNRGSYSVAGQTLDFTTGRVRFDGTGVRGRLDPTLDFVAQTISGGVTATLTVGGYASAPKITLSSNPPLPQDEVVAHLLFQQSVKQLTPLQLASIAQAVAAMGGIGGGFNPLGTVRRTLGLDRLSVGSANGGATGSQSQTTVEAGRYVTRNVYVGVKQNLSGGTQTQVQVDITRRLKAQATVSTSSSGPTTQGNALQDNGSSVGLSYQFDY